MQERVCLKPCDRSHKLVVCDTRDAGDEVDCLLETVACGGNAWVLVGW